MAKRLKIKLKIKRRLPTKDEHSGADRSLQRQLNTLGNDYARQIATLENNCIDRQLAQLAPKRRAKRHRAK